MATYAISVCSRCLHCLISLDCLCIRSLYQAGFALDVDSVLNLNCGAEKHVYLELAELCPDVVTRVFKSLLTFFELRQFAVIFFIF